MIWVLVKYWVKHFCFRRRKKKKKEKTNAQTLLLIIMYRGKPKINSFYYIDTSVLLENIPLVTFIKTTSGT